jgi:carbon monoxide dehydrogenase subunit G
VQLENTFTVAAPIDEAWKVLLDPERVARCMPGATLDEAEGDEFKGRVKVKVGPIVVTYQGTAKFVEKDEQAHRAVIDAAGKESRGSGTARATVTTALIERGEQTEVTVVTDLNITGRPAQFGRGVIADVAGKLTDTFATNLAGELSGSATNAAAGASPAGSVATNGAAGEPGAQAATTTATAPPPAATARGGTRPADDDVIDLLGVSTAPILKRLLPVLAGSGVLLLLIALLRRSGRRD